MCAYKICLSSPCSLRTQTCFCEIFLLENRKDSPLGVLQLLVSLNFPSLTWRTMKHTNHPHPRGAIKGGENPIAGKTMGPPLTRAVRALGTMEMIAGSYLTWCMIGIDKS